MMKILAWLKHKCTTKKSFEKWHKKIHRLSLRKEQGKSDLKNWTITKPENERDKNEEAQQQPK